MSSCTISRHPDGRRHIHLDAEAAEALEYFLDAATAVLGGFVYTTVRDGREVAESIEPRSDDDRRGLEVAERIREGLGQ